jgi:dolichyl-phosphate-mannose-protein mannosyltransferase
MMTSNNALVPDPDKQDDLASAPWQWPLLHVGLRMCSWSDETVKYFLLGNPVVYWGSTFSIGFIMVMFAWYVIRWQRGYDELTWTDVDQFHYSGIYPLIGWFLHYMPFIAMARVTYVHHYYPALYFAILVAGFVVDWYTRSLKNPAVKSVIFAVLYGAVIFMFWLFRAFCFGMVGPNQQWYHLRWFDQWRMADAPKAA